MEDLDLFVNTKRSISCQKLKIFYLYKKLNEKIGSFNVKLQEENKIENQVITNKKIFVCIPVLIIIFAEILVYLGGVLEALLVYLTLLIGLSLSTGFTRDKETQENCQVLILLPLLRLASFSMPIFFKETLYSFVLVYSSLIFPIMILISYQQITREEIGLNFRRIWFYIPLSLLIGFILGAGEYRVIQTNNLIPDLSPLNLLILSAVMVLFAGFIEEIIFRSFLQTRLNKIFGAWEGIVLSSLLFSLMHSGYGISHEILYIFLTGVFIGYIYYRTRSLPLVALVHGFINVFLFGVFPFLGLRMLW